MTKNIKPYHENAPGDFFVEDGCCIICDVPRQTAPDLFKYNKKGDHCFVYKQPQTDDELSRMIEAAQASEVACIHYRGSCNKIKQKLSE